MTGFTEKELRQRIAFLEARVIDLENSANKVVGCLSSQVPTYIDELEIALNRTEPQSLAALSYASIQAMFNEFHFLDDYGDAWVGVAEVQLALDAIVEFERKNGA